MKALTVDKLIKLFPYPTIPPVLGVSTYKTITPVYLKLNNNIASIHLNRDNSKVGHLILTL